MFHCISSEKEIHAVLAKKRCPTFHLMVLVTASLINTVYRARGIPREPVSTSVTAKITGGNLHNNHVIVKINTSYHSSDHDSFEVVFRYCKIFTVRHNLISLLFPVCCTAMNKCSPATFNMFRYHSPHHYRSSCCIVHLQCSPVTHTSIAIDHVLAV